jgi:murein L,D-transpeptidase YafK
MLHSSPIRTGCDWKSRIFGRKEERAWKCGNALANRNRSGRGGVGKTREGDGKTPIGTYGLGDPRPSNRYGTFIPIEYPTDEQKHQGFTGSAVGVHGPGRWVKWLGRLVNTFDWSDGCVGVATDGEIERIATWVRSTSARTIELR